MRTRIVRRARVVITARTLDHGSMVAEEQRCNSLLGRNVGRGGNCELPSGQGTGKLTAARIRSEKEHRAYESR